MISRSIFRCFSFWTTFSRRTGPAARSQSRVGPSSASAWRYCSRCDLPGRLFVRSVSSAAAVLFIDRVDVRVRLRSGHLVRALVLGVDVDLDRRS